MSDAGGDAATTLSRRQNRETIEFNSYSEGGWHQLPNLLLIPVPPESMLPPPGANAPRTASPRMEQSLWRPENQRHKIDAARPGASMPPNAGTGPTQKTPALAGAEQDREHRTDPAWRCRGTDHILSDGFAHSSRDSHSHPPHIANHRNVRPPRIPLRAELRTRRSHPPTDSHSTQRHETQTVRLCVLCDSAVNKGLGMVSKSGKGPA